MIVIFEQFLSLTTFVCFLAVYECLQESSYIIVMYYKSKSTAECNLNHALATSRND